MPAVAGLDLSDRGLRNPDSVSDVGVGAGATRACIDGAALNVRINLGQLKDEKFKSELSKQAEKFRADSETRFKEISRAVESKIG